MTAATVGILLALALAVFVMGAAYTPRPRPVVCCCQMATIPPGWDFTADPSRVHTPTVCMPLHQWADRGCQL